MGDTLYKWLRPGRLTGWQEAQWPATKGRWCPEESSPEVCRRGWHAVSLGAIIRNMPWLEGMELWEVETKGKEHRVERMVAAEQMRLSRLIGTTTPLILRAAGQAVAADAGIPDAEERFARMRSHDEDVTAAWWLIFVANAAADDAGTAAIVDRASDLTGAMREGWTEAVLAAHTRADTVLIDTLAGATSG